MFAPYDRRDRESDHKNQGESDHYDDGWAAIVLARRCTAVARFGVTRWLVRG
jgi:hypothetical protein